MEKFEILSWAFQLGLLKFGNFSCRLAVRQRGWENIKI